MSTSQEYDPAAKSLRREQQVSFAENTFRRILSSAVDTGYRFIRFDDPAALLPQAGTPIFHLRHDVDISPDMAFRLGEIEHEKGICGNFFFQLNAETYSFFGTDTLAMIRDLRSMGHCVGLHIDERLLGFDEQAIGESLDWVNKHVIAIDPVVSFHRPSPAVLGRRFKTIINTYDDRLFDPAFYLSDSRRSLAFHQPLMDWIRQEKPRIQLLLHPEWWEEVSSLNEFWTLLSRRRTDQLRQYMRVNFPKLFADLLGRENGGPEIYGPAPDGQRHRPRPHKKVTFRPHS